MIRLVSTALVCLVSSAWVCAGEAPERLLTPSTQLYLRWDGVTPHKAAYQASALGSVMAGPTGDTVKTLLARAPKYIAGRLLVDTLLDGKSIEQMKEVRDETRLLGKVIDLLTDHGAIIAAEVRTPRPTVGEVGKAIGGAFLNPSSEANPLQPRYTVFLIVPDVGKDGRAFFTPTRLFNRGTGKEVAKPLPKELGLEGFIWSSGDESEQMAEWLIDGHYVEYIGNVPVSTVIGEMRKSLKAGGLTANELFKQAARPRAFESVARGFLDTKSAIGLTKLYGSLAMPGLAERIDSLGISNLQAIVFSSGFDGKESRATYELVLPGQRQGLTRILSRKPLALADLPPFPPDVSRFSALRINPAAAFDAGVGVVEAGLKLEGTNSTLKMRRRPSPRRSRSARITSSANWTRVSAFPSTTIC